MAYNKIPENAKDAGKLVRKLQPSNTKKASAILRLWTGLHEKYETKLTGPLAFDETKPNQVKIARALKEDYSLADIKKEFNLSDSGLTLSFGDGSRGQRGAGNRGNLFEQELSEYLYTWKEEGVIPTGPFQSFAKDIIKIYDLESCHLVEVTPEGELNKKRPMSIVGNSWMIGEATSANYDIGKTVTDITIRAKNGTDETIYLSLKTSGTTTMSNLGVARSLSARQIEDGLITDPTGVAILKTFGINNELFCKIFQEAKRGEVTSGTVEKNASYDQVLLKSMIKGSIGYGYHYCHKQKGGYIKNFKMTKAFVDAVANGVTGVDVYYGGQTGEGKRFNMIVKTPMIEFRFNIRDTSGGKVYPDKLQSGYKFADELDFSFATDDSGRKDYQDG